TFDRKNWKVRNEYRVFPTMVSLTFHLDRFRQRPHETLTPQGKGETMITQATKEQWNNVERIKDWWLTTQLVEQYSDETMRASASAMLSAKGQSVPLILCVSSPIEARLYSGVISRLNSKLNSKLNSQLDSQLRSQLSSQLRSQLNSKLNS